jgi:hypothetical protein
MIWLNRKKLFLDLTRDVALALCCVVIFPGHGIFALSLANFSQSLYRKNTNISITTQGFVFRSKYETMQNLL